MCKALGLGAILFIFFFVACSFDLEQDLLLHYICETSLVEKPSELFAVCSSLEINRKLRPSAECVPENLFIDEL